MSEIAVTTRFWRKIKMIKMIQLVEKKTSIIIIFDIVFYKINISKNIINVVKMFVQCVHQIMILSISLLII